MAVALAQRELVAFRPIQLDLFMPFITFYIIFYAVYYKIVFMPFSALTKLNGEHIIIHLKVSKFLLNKSHTGEYGLYGHH